MRMMVAAVVFAFAIAAAVYLLNQPEPFADYARRTCSAHPTEAARQACYEHMILTKVLMPKNGD